MFKYFMGVSTSQAPSSSSSSRRRHRHRLLSLLLFIVICQATAHTQHGTHAPTYTLKTHTHIPVTYTHTHVSCAVLSLAFFVRISSATVKEAENPLSYFSLARKLSEKPFKDSPLHSSPLKFGLPHAGCSAFVEKLCMSFLAL